MYEAWLHESKEAVDYQIALALKPCSRSRFFSDWCCGSVGQIAIRDVEEIVGKKDILYISRLG